MRQADLVLLDPPYGGEAARAVLVALAECGLGSETRVVVEHHAKDDLPERPPGFLRVRQRRYGETVVSTYAIETTSVEVDRRADGEDR